MVLEGGRTTTLTNHRLHHSLHYNPFSRFCSSSSSLSSRRCSQAPHQHIRLSTSIHRPNRTRSTTFPQNSKSITTLFPRTLPISRLAIGKIWTVMQRTNTYNTWAQSVNWNGRGKKGPSRKRKVSSEGIRPSGSVRRQWPSLRVISSKAWATGWCIDSAVDSFAKDGGILGWPFVCALAPGHFERTDDILYSEQLTFDT
jgi:hypothetical protein